MFHKFKITTYATLLLIGVFVLPYAGNVADVNAKDYNCRGSKKEVRQCLKAVISERDNKIGEYHEVLEVLHYEASKILNKSYHDGEYDLRTELSKFVDEFKYVIKKMEEGLKNL